MNINGTAVIAMLVMLFCGNVLLLMTLIDKHQGIESEQSIGAAHPFDSAMSLKQNGNSKLDNKPISLTSDNKESSEKKDVMFMLWEDMTPAQQKEAIEISMPYFKRHTELIQKRANQGKGNFGKVSFDYSCRAKEVGAGWSGHHLCTDLLERSDTCEFFSFGIANAYSFEKVVSDNFHCHGFAADPTVSHPSNIYKNITFHQIGANILTANEEMTKNNADSNNGEWWVTSVPQLKKALNVPHLNILKMDCEGCEYALARDIIKDDPTFLQHVDQFVVEVHLPRQWLNSTETLFYYGALLKMLDDNGLRLHDVRTLGCDPKHTKTGCFEPALCGGQINLCHNYLFAKI